MKKGFLIKCPICRKDSEWSDNESRPFCSERCRLIDLGRWASGDYVLPGEEVLLVEEPAES